MTSFYLYLLKAVLVVLSAGKVEFPCNRSFVSFFCVDIQRWGKRRLRPYSRRAPVVHATALPRAGADKTSRVLNRVEQQGRPRVQCQSAKNSNGHNNLLSWTTINCRWLLRIKILRRYPKLSNYRLEMHLFCFYPPCRLFLLYLKHCWSCWRIWDLLLELLW